MATAVVVHQPYFDEFGYQYKCCCRSCHVKTGTLIIGILSAIGIVLSLIQNGAGITNVQRLNKSNPDLDSGFLMAIFVVQVVVFGLQGIAVVCLFIGWARENRQLLIPYMAVQILGMVLVVAMTILCIALLFIGGDHVVDLLTALSNKGTNKTLGDVRELKQQLKGMITAIILFMIVLYSVVLGIQIWLFKIDM